MKYLKILLLIIFTLELLGFVAIFLAPAAIFAAEAKFTPQVSIGDFVKGEEETVEKSGRTLWNYIMAIYKYAIGVVGILAAVILMVGGIMWLTAGGNQTRIGEAKAYITASLTGLLLALTSFLILATVNPRLVEFNPIDVKNVTEYKNVDTLSGCCAENNICNFKTKTDCKGTWQEGYICNGEGGSCITQTCCRYDYSASNNKYYRCQNTLSDKKSCEKMAQPGYILDKTVDFQTGKRCYSEIFGSGPYECK